MSQTPTQNCSQALNLYCIATNYKPVHSDPKHTHTKKRQKSNFWFTVLEKMSLKFWIKIKVGLNGYNVSWIKYFFVGVLVL